MLTQLKLNGIKQKQHMCHKKQLQHLNELRQNDLVEPEQYCSTKPFMSEWGTRLDKEILFHDNAPPPQNRCNIH